MSKDERTIVWAFDKESNARDCLASLIDWDDRCAPEVQRNEEERSWEVSVPTSYQECDRACTFGCAFAYARNDGAWPYDRAPWKDTGS